MGDFFCIKNKSNDMSDEDCVREVLISGTKKNAVSICSMCKVKGRINRERPNLVKEVLSKMLGENAADRLLAKTSLQAKTSGPVNTTEPKEMAKKRRKARRSTPLLSKKSAQSNTSEAEEAENISAIQEEASMPKKKEFRKDGRRFVRVCKKCPKCGTEATTNVAPSCKNCGALFEKTGRKASTTTKGAQTRPTGYLPEIIEKATSALVSIGHKQSHAGMAVKAVCAEAGKDLQGIIKEAIQYLSNGHSVPPSAVSASRKNKVVSIKKKVSGKSAVSAKVQSAVIDNENMIVTVDFSEYPELHRKLITAAKEEIRQPADQVMAIIADWRSIETKVGKPALVSA